MLIDKRNVHYNQSEYDHSLKNVIFKPSAPNYLKGVGDAARPQEILLIWNAQSMVNHYRSNTQGRDQANWGKPKFQLRAGIVLSIARITYFNDVQ